MRHYVHNRTDRQRVVCEDGLRGNSVETATRTYPNTMLVLVIVGRFRRSSMWSVPRHEYPVKNSTNLRSMSRAEYASHAS